MRLQAHSRLLCKEFFDLSKNDCAGLFSVDILDPDIYVPLAILYYFRTGISSLQTLGYVPAKTLFGFGFDFRRARKSDVPLHLLMF